jgi:hypothetical protein
LMKNMIKQIVKHASKPRWIIIWAMPRTSAPA